MTRTCALLCFVSLPCSLASAAQDVAAAASRHSDADQQDPRSKTLPRSSDRAKKAKKPRPPFRWVNPLKESQLPNLEHRTFRSPSMDLDVGYCIYLPSAYSRQSDRKFPVVYYLHGGRPGSELKSIKLVTTLHRHMEAGKVGPMIYVFVNGGPVSHYNMRDRENARGEDVFVRELIPHVDSTYRTIASRKGRAVEGFSQGGRGTTRIMFKHPDLFCSAAPGGSGYATEKKISENNGQESETLVFAPGDNTWDLARRYADRQEPPLKILLHVGTDGFNYPNNLQFMEHLSELKIPFESLIVEGVPHSAQKIYEKQGIKLMRFHARNFRKAQTEGS